MKVFIVSFSDYFEIEAETKDDKGDKVVKKAVVKKVIVDSDSQKIEVVKPKSRAKKEKQGA